MTENFNDISLELFKSVLDESDDNIQIIYLDDFSLLYANKASMRDSYEKGDWNNTPCYKYMHGNNSQCENCVLTENDGTAETEVNGKRFSVRYEHVTINGRPAVIKYAKNITEYKRAIEDYKSKVMNLVGIIPKVQNVVYADLEEGTILYADVPGKKDEYARSDAFDRYISAVCDIILDKKEAEGFKVLASREHLIDVYNAGKTYVKVEYLCKHKNGRHIWYQLSSILMRNPENNHIETIIFATDVNDIKGEEIAFENEIYGMVIYHIYDDGQIAIEKMSRKANELLNIYPNVKGEYELTSFDFVADEDRERINKVFEDKTKNNRLANVREEFRVKRGTVSNWVMISDLYLSEGVDDYGVYRRRQAIIVDIEEGKRTEHANEILAEITQNNVSGVIAYRQSDKNIIIYNEEANRINDYDLNDPEQYDEFISGKNHKILPEYIPNIREAVSKIKKPGDKAEYVYAIKHNDGNIVVVKTETKRILLSDGLDVIVSTQIDITNEQKLSSSLEEEKAAYRYAIENSSVLTLCADITDDIILGDIFTTEGIPTLNDLGLSTSVSYMEFLEKSIEYLAFTFVEGEVLPKSSKDIVKNYFSGIKNYVADFYSETHRKYYRFNASVSEDRMNGHLNLLCFGRDITDIYQNSLLTKLENDERFAVINAFSSFYVASYLFDLVSMEARTIKRSGYSNVELSDSLPLLETRNQFINNVVVEEHRAEMIEFTDLITLNDRMKGKKMISKDYLNTKGYWMRAYYIPVQTKADGTITQVILAITVIQEEKMREFESKRKLENANRSLKVALEEANKANNAKNEFLSNMAHDIRTPINGILGMLAMCESNIDDKDIVKDSLGKTKDSAVHLKNFINDVLDMSKLESGKIMLVDEQFSINSVKDYLISINMPHAKERNITIESNVNSVKHDLVVGSAMHIKRALQSVFDNAVRFNVNGGKVLFDIEEIPINENYSTYVFTIEDTGIGMSEDYTNQAFLPFTREKKTVSKDAGNAGLGLAIAKGLLEKMSGKITAESVKDKGTVVKVELILELAKKVENKQEKNSLNGVKVLLVEDNELNLEIAGFMLEKAGLSVVRAGDGQEAVNIVVNSVPGEINVIVMDILMPNMNGIDATAYIRKMDKPEIKDIPIIAMTTNVFPEEIQAYKEIGFNDYVSKPINSEELLEKVAKQVLK